MFEESAGAGNSVGGIERGGLEKNSSFEQLQCLVRENGGTGTKSMFKMLKIDDGRGSRYFRGLNGPRVFTVVRLFT